MTVSIGTAYAACGVPTVLWVLAGLGAIVLLFAGLFLYQLAAEKLVPLRPTRKS